MSPNAMEPKTDRELLIMINEHVIQLKDDMQEVKKKLPDMIDSDFCDRQHVDITKKLLSHGIRLTKLENWRWYLMGVFAAAIVIITALIQIIRN